MRHRKAISIVLAASIIAGGIVPMAGAVSATDYEDFNSAAWYAPAVEYVVKNGIMIGTSKTTLTVDRNITRAEFVSLIDRLFATYKLADITSFTDVPDSLWSHDNIAMGVQMGTLEGTSKTTASPEGMLTREMAMTVLARALAIESDNLDQLKMYTDGKNVSSWAKPYVAVLMEQGRVQGYTDQSLRPQQYITRAETAQLLMRCFSSISGQTSVDNVTDDGIYLLRSGKDSTIQNSSFKDTLILANGMKDSNVYLKNTNINRLLCWGSHDVWIYPGCTVKEIVISRTDGPCYIHWLGNSKDLPKITIRKGVSEDTKVVDGNNKQLYPAIDDTTKPSNNHHHSSSNSKSIAYFDPCNGESVSSVAIGDDGLVQPIKDPVYANHRFDGWYTDKSYTQKADFTGKVEKGTTFYAKWTVVDDGDSKIIEDLNQTANALKLSIKVDTDLLAIVGDSKIACNIRNAQTDTRPVKIELIRKDNNEVLGTIDKLNVGESADVLSLSVNMPSYGNYPVYWRITPIDGSNGLNIDAMLYVAYKW